MSSKQQYKDYTNRLKAEIKKIKAEKEILQKQVFRLKMQPKELKLPVVTNRFSYKSFMAGFMVGGLIVLLMLQILL